MGNYYLGLFATNELLLTPVSQLDGKLPPHVSLWLMWMLVVAVTSLVWSFWKFEARYVLAAFAAAFVTALLLPPLIGEQNVVYATLSVIHIVFWTPALVLLWRRRAAVNRSLYGVWLDLAMATMAISLIFDYRDAIAWLLI